LLAHLLAVRDISSPEDARRFLYPSLDDLHDPRNFKQVDIAVERIFRALQTNEKVLIFGDYDADGVSSMALLAQFFKLAHFQVEPPFAPNRVSEGYGLNMNAIEDIARRGITLLITVDCGINDVDELHRARELGVDTIIVDHHEHSGSLPPAAAILNPKSEGCTYPFRELAAVGVTFKLIQALAARFSASMKLTPEFQQFFDEALGLVALGSVSDVVPLVGENRILVYHGLKMLSRSQSPGLRALMDVSSVPYDRIDTWHIAYQIGPRINVAGRLKEAQVAVELLTTDSTQRAWEIAKELDKENRSRQKIEKEIFESAVEKLKDLDLNEKNIVIVLSDESWHPGVIGIVAARLVEEYHRPAILIALEGDRGRGSARSIPAYHIHEALTACEDKLLTFGGHSFAAGIEILKSEIESFNIALCRDAREKLTDEDLVPKLHIDAELNFADITEPLLGEIRRLAPHGRGNPNPLFWARDVRLVGRPQQVGTKGNHLTLFLNQAGVALRGIAFGKGSMVKDLESRGENLEIAFRPRYSQYSGRIELDIKDIRFPAVS
jgi:single-stranded-DNA-specific exonuclease